MEPPNAGVQLQSRTDGDSFGDATTALSAQMIPDALSQSLTASGGIGLARQLYEALGGDTSTDAADSAPAKERRTT